MSSDLLICPRCLANIPLINHTVKNGKALVEIKCRCNKFQKQELYIEDFLSVCEKLLREKHINSYQFVILRCSDHRNMEIVSYCKQCGKNLCSECEKDIIHEGHEIVSIRKLCKELDLDELMDNFEKSKNNVLINNELSKSLLIDSLNAQIEKINEIIKNVEEAYDFNRSINESLIDLIDSLIRDFNNTVRDDDLTNYNILQNLLNNTKFNFNQCDIDERNLLDSAEKLIKYYKNNFIVRKNYKELICLKEIAEPKKKCIHSIFEITEKRLAATCENDIYIYSLPDLKEIDKYTGHIGDINALDGIVIDDNNYLLSCSDDKNIRIWDELYNKCVLLISEHESKVSKVIPLVNEKIYYKNCIASCSWDKTIKIFDISQVVSGKFTIKGVLEGHTKYVKDIFLLTN